MYEKHILRILRDVGARGISIKKLAKHVYNLSCTLFYQPDFNEVYGYTRCYVLRESRKKQGLVEHAQKWGHYRLNRKTVPDFAQLMQKMGYEQKEEPTAEAEGQPPPDRSLSLFF